jgi:hypothetical protein
MTTGQKVWIWIKAHWYLPLIVVLGIALFFVGQSDWAIGVIKNIRKSYGDQVAAIEALNKEEQEKKDALQQQYDIVIKALEAKYAIDQKVLQEEEKNKVKELVGKYEKDPEGLTKELADVFGLKVI